MYKIKEFGTEQLVKFAKENLFYYGNVVPKRKNIYKNKPGYEEGGDYKYISQIKQYLWEYVISKNEDVFKQW